MFKHDPYASKTYGKEGGAPAPVKRVSQETFDEVVKENMEDFDMSPEDAVKDAMEQFALEGVDLGNIDKRAPGEDGAKSEDQHPVLAAVAVLKDGILPKLGLGVPLVGDDGAAITLAVPDDEIVGNLTELFKFVSTDAAAKELATHHDLGALLVKLLLRAQARVAVVGPLLSVVRAVTTKNDAAREQFCVSGTGQGPELVCACAKRFETHVGVLERAFFATAQSATRHEVAKLTYAKHGMLELLAAALGAHAKDAKVVRAACSGIAALCTADDFRKPTSKAIDHARRLMDPDDIDAADAFAAATVAQQEDAAACASLCNAIRALAVRDEICDTLFEKGVLVWAVGVGARHGLELDNATCARMACRALATLARNDRNKCAICEGDGLHMVLATAEKFAEDAAVIEQTLAVLATVCLRHPMNVEVVMERDGARVIVQAMRQHAGVANVQKQGCLAIRNMAVRNPELRPAIIAEGAEPLIRAARAAHPQRCSDLAFAALRDLGLDYE